MKVKVINSFIDKENKRIQPVGVILDITEKRYEEIMSYKDEQLVELVADSNNIDVDLNRNVETVTEAIHAELGKDTLSTLLEQEKAGKNRKGVIEHIEQLIKEVE